MPVILDRAISGSGGVDMASSARVSIVAVHLLTIGPQVGWSWQPDNLHRAGFVQLASYINFGGYGSRPYWRPPLWLHAMDSSFILQAADGSPAVPGSTVQRLRWELSLGTSGWVWVFGY